MLDQINTCKHRINGLCQIATDISKIPTEANDATCYACSTLPNPQCENKVTQGLALASIHNNSNGDRQTIVNHPSDVLNKLIGSIQSGPGTELRKLISWFPVKKDGCARCSHLEAVMNEWGPDKCLQQMSYILTYMEVTARQNEILWNYYAVKLLVHAAIRLSRK